VGVCAIYCLVRLAAVYVSLVDIVTGQPTGIDTWGSLLAKAICYLVLFVMFVRQLKERRQHDDQ
jgi:hypothetical protein